MAGVTLEGVYMGVFLDSKTAYTLYKNETEKPFFADKSRMLEELFPLVREGNNYRLLRQRTIISI